MTDSQWKVLIRLLRAVEAYADYSSFKAEGETLDDSLTNRRRELLDVAREADGAGVIDQAKIYFGPQWKEAGDRQ